MIVEIIYDYEILRAETHYKLTDLVKAYLIKGWQPQGGVMADIGQDFVGMPTSHYYQAIVKKERKEVRG
ncbi:MAG: hypothetical protein WC208_08470 [Gallionella sp.]